MNKRLTKKTMTLFESIKHIDENGVEYWTSRSLWKVLEYTEYRNFLPVIEKAKIACENSGQRVENHFVDIHEMVEIGSGAELQKHNSELASAAKDAGVIDSRDYVIFQNYGYQGLYGGMTAKDIHARKGLKQSQKILDHMGSTELAANLFRATQTEEKLRRENIKGKQKANMTHYEVGAKVRQTIKELGGTMPEDLPNVDSIKIVEKIQQKLLNSKKRITSLI